MEILNGLVADHRWLQNDINIKNNLNKHKQTNKNRQTKAQKQAII
jgi:hypothetical protein